MRISDFIGYGDRLQQLMRSVQAGRIVHALLITGPAGSGKRTLAGLFSQALMCTSPGSRPCGQCPACQRVSSGVHPDILILRPEKGKKVIPVSAIRTTLRQYISHRPYEGGSHIAIIEQADRMNTEAQNALLKILEEPPGATMFFLIAEQPDRLLTTIRSRCQTVRLRDLSVADCQAVLQRHGLPPERAALLSGLAQGSVGRALLLDTDNDRMALRDQVIQSLQALRGPASVAGAAVVLEDYKGREADILDIMELWARDLMAVQAGADPFELQDASALRASPLDGRALLMAVMRARSQLSANVSWTNVLETLFFGLAGGETPSFGISG